MSASTDVELFQARQLTPAQQSVAVPDRADIDSWVFVASDVIKLATYICETDFVPRAYRGNKYATAAAILAGRELGLPPMTALRHVHIVEGSASLSAEYKRARVLGAGHDLDIVELGITRCVISARRNGSGKPAQQFTFTIEDARRANLVKPKGAWETRPRRMLFARACTEACDFMFTDITNGLPTAELLEAGGSEDDVLAGYNESPGQDPPAAIGPPKPRTAQRRTAKAEAADRPTGAPSAGGSGEAALDLRPPATAKTARSDRPSTPAGADHGDQPPFPDDDPAPPANGNGEDRHRKLAGIMHQNFKRLGFGEGDVDRNARLIACERIAGSGPLESSSDLSIEQLSVIADTLARCKTRQQLNALLVAGDKPESGPGQDGGNGG